MKLFYYLSSIFFFFVVSHVFFINTLYAQIPSSTPTSVAADSTKQNELQNKVKEYQAKVTELQGQTKTLSSQVTVMDTQISLTEARMAVTSQQMKQLNADIAIASTKVTTLENSLDGITKVLLKKVVATYTKGNIQPLDILLTSDSASNAITKLHYLTVVKEHNQKLLINTMQAKQDYENQKSLFETKKEKVLVLQKELESYTKQLDTQKKEKENLLATTKNSEKEYQKMLSAAMRELQQIQGAAQALVSTEPRHVSKGEVIGLMGNSGYSSGAHLHFGIYNITSLSQYDYYSSHESPLNSLESKSVSWDTGCGSDPSGAASSGTGSFAWPLDTGNLTISQGYGITCWSSVYYKGKPHPALDMYNNTAITVKAVEEGQAYICRNCTGDGANGVFVFHPNGKMSLYWHLQ